MTSYDSRYNQTITADDGRELTVSWFVPAVPRGSVLVAPAMATRASFYRPLARWLAQAGFLTLTFDYRGTGSVAELKAETGDLLRWAGDAASALEELVRAADGLPVTWLGHSLGGQVLPFAHHGLVDQAVVVASGNGYWRYNAPAVRRRAPLLWHTVAPGAIAAAGYFPGRRLRIIGDVPANVMRQWRRWCLSPGYFEADVPRVRDRVAHVTTPLTSLWFTDDELITARAIDAMDDLYLGTAVERLRLDPAGCGLDRVGHHGFFRDAGRSLWESVLLPRLAAVPAAAPGDDAGPAPAPVGESPLTQAPMMPVG
jgi:predicted alpha/beta hydrolase